MALYIQSKANNYYTNVVKLTKHQESHLLPPHSEPIQLQLSLHKPQEAEEKAPESPIKEGTINFKHNDKKKCFFFLFLNTRRFGAEALIPQAQ